MGAIILSNEPIFCADGSNATWSYVWLGEFGEVRTDTETYTDTDTDADADTDTDTDSETLEG